MIAALLSVLSLAGAEAAQPGVVDPVPVASAEAPAPGADVVSKKDKLVCKNHRPTGSRMATRVCRTAEDLERRRENAQKNFDTMNENKTKAKAY